MPKCIMCGKIRKVGDRYRVDENLEMVHDDCVSLEFLVDSGVDPKSAAQVWTQNDYRTERRDYGGWYVERYGTWFGLAVQHRPDEGLHFMIGSFGFTYYYG